MSKITMNNSFGERNFVEKQSLCELEYNSTIDVPANTKIIVEDNNRKRTEFLKSDGNILNPKPKGLFSFVKKIDYNTYGLYFVDSSYVDVKCGGWVNVKNRNIEELEYEKVFFRSIISFKVSNCKSFINNYIGDDFSHYSRDYFRDKLKIQFEPIIESVISTAINCKGLSMFDSDREAIIAEIEEKLEERFSERGIAVKLSSIDIKEDEKIQTIKEDTQLRTYQINKMKEIK